MEKRTLPEGNKTRRAVLQQASLGFGTLALSSLMSDSVVATESSPQAGLQLPAKAKNVIFCFMSGGVSHVDSFDPKPRLEKEHGQPMPGKVERTMFNNNGNIFGSPFKFKPHGESGLPVSNLFPHVAECADELAVVRSMTSKSMEHAQANCFLHTGFPFLGHPSAGAWVTYGLGSENKNLPGFVVLQSGSAVIPHGGVRQFGNGYLPAETQASILKADQPEAIANITPQEIDSSQLVKQRFVRQIDQGFAEAVAGDKQVEAAIQNYETAYRMQAAVPDLCDLSDETEPTLRKYGIDHEDADLAAYGRQCLMARRLVERGVRFIELSCLSRNIGGGGGPNPWDQHGELERGHQKMAMQVDQPIAALIKDLRERGLLDETLIVWAGEFGRTPFSQGGSGRDHNPYGFSVWLAGGGVKGGMIYGATDDYGYRVTENKATVYDLWATVLHQLGIHHMDLIYRYGGRDFRLTDVHGHVLHDILA
ncbi:MAG: DUF1501 domain-containing protein [Pirellulaceae bacterium]|nr:DUF1501 domain-containing protein [Pirellulaceae bacterium]